MTKLRTYTVVSGSDPVFVATVRGKASPALSTLYKHFEEQYDFVPEKSRGNIPDAVTIIRNVTSRNKAYSKMIADGLDGKTIAECFVMWLVKCHDFSIVETSIFRLG